jgi:GNAT superfamily N-acetyltransferase
VPPDVRITSQPAVGFVDWLAERLYEFNVAATGIDDGEWLVASIEQDGRTIAALSGNTWGGCCEVDNVWVEEAARGRGLGRALLEAAETEARRRGCVQIVLSTHSFQAPLFYEKLGFKRIGAVPDRPRGYQNLIYLKRLT